MIANRAGRVFDERGDPVTGIYCAGWIKRGPSGVIGTNKKDASETVESILEDARGGLLQREDGDLAELLARARRARSSTTPAGRRSTRRSAARRAARQAEGQARPLGGAARDGAVRSRTQARLGPMTGLGPAVSSGEPRRRRRSRISRSPASRSRFRSRAGSAASRPPRRARTRRSGCSTPTRRPGSRRPPTGSRAASSTISSPSTSSRPAPAHRRT